MPRPEQTPAPTYKGLPYGMNQQANDMAEVVQLQQDSFPAFAPTDQVDEPDAEFQPASDEESFLFGPTDRPTEPITAGVPFGDGNDFSRYSYETDDDFLGRVSMQLEPNPSREVQQFRAAIAQGL